MFSSSSASSSASPGSLVLADRRKSCAVSHGCRATMPAAIVRHAIPAAPARHFSSFQVGAQVSATVDAQVLAGKIGVVESRRTLSSRRMRPKRRLQRRRAPGEHQVQVLLRRLLGLGAATSVMRPAAAILFVQEPGDIKCFYVETTAPNQEWQLAYDVNSEAEILGVAFSVHPRNNPRNRMAASTRAAEEIQFKGQQDESYAVCFENTQTAASGANQLVSLDLFKSEHHSILPATATRAEKTQELVEEVAERVNAVSTQQEFALTREGFQRKIVEDLNSGCLWWASFEAVCTMVFGVLQMRFLKGFFETKAYV